MSSSSLFMKTDIYRKYDFGEVLGTGNFAEVRLATSRETGEKVAIKIIEPRKTSDDVLIRREVEVLGKLNHPNITRLIEIYEQPPKFRTKKKMFIVMELVTGGELFDRLVQKRSFTESEARSVFKTLLEALDYMHANGVVHRDLKPENILYATSDPNSPIKIADFGLARLYDPDVDGPGMKTMCGTPGYVAPEVLHPKDKAKGYTTQVDMWAAGVILYVLLCGFPPFYDQDQDKLFRLIIRGHYDFPSPFWDNITPEAIAMVRLCLQTDPDKRITPREALKHPWMHSEKVKLDSVDIDTKNLRKYILRQKFKRVKNAIIAVGRMQLALASAMNRRKS